MLQQALGSPSSPASARSTLSSHRAAIVGNWNERNANASASAGMATSGSGAEQRVIGLGIRAATPPVQFATLGEGSKIFAASVPRSTPDKAGSGYSTSISSTSLSAHLTGQLEQAQIFHRAPALPLLGDQPIISLPKRPARETTAPDNGIAQKLRACAADDQSRADNPAPRPDPRSAAASVNNNSRPL